MNALKGLVTGFIVVLVLEVVGFLVAGLVLASQEAASLRLDIGGLPVFVYEHSDRVVSTQLGPGIFVIAAIAGVLNGLGALVLTRSEPRATR
jgi:hypothetical protein